MSTTVTTDHALRCLAHLGYSAGLFKSGRHREYRLERGQISGFLVDLSRSRLMKTAAERLLGDPAFTLLLVPLGLHAVDMHISVTSSPRRGFEAMVQSVFNDTVYGYSHRHHEEALAFGEAIVDAVCDAFDR